MALEEHQVAGPGPRVAHLRWGSKVGLVRVVGMRAKASVLPAGIAATLTAILLFPNRSMLGFFYLLLQLLYLVVRDLE